MCDICEGKEPIPELYEGYTPGPIWFGTNGVITGNKRLKASAASTRSDLEKMKELRANVMIPGSEETTYYRFKFCPECGRKLIDETNESRSESEKSKKIYCPATFCSRRDTCSWKVFGTITDKIDSDTVTNELKVPPCTFTGSAI